MINAAGKTDCIFDALTPEPYDGVEAADAVVAIDNELFAVGEGFDAVDVGGDRIHGDQLAGFDAGGGVFVIFAAIEKDDGSFVCQELSELACWYFVG